MSTPTTPTPDVTTVDVVVLGMGVGGEDVAGNLASAGLSVIGIESTLVGGECPYWGCIPSKMMVRAAGVLAEARRIPDLAGTSTVTPDWAPVAARIRAEATDDWDDTVAVDRFTDKGGTFVRGRGRLVADDALLRPPANTQASAALTSSLKAPTRATFCCISSELKSTT